MQIRGTTSLRVAAGAALLFGGITAAQAGFFERLFGVESEPEQPRYYYQPAPDQGHIDEAPARRERRPLDFTVRSRSKERAVHRDRKNEPRGLQRGQVETAGVPSGPIDPAGNPDWYLQDPTLRTGDIVVLDKEVLVFRGGRMPFSRANFASLSQSDLPKEERERLAYMTGLKPVLLPRTSVASAD
jgi:hypothetical protein